MQYKHLGRSGLRVSELCLGTMSFGDAWGFGANADDSRAIFNRFAEAGGTFLDTANFYHKGQTEQIVGDLIAADRDRFVVGTKYSLNMYPNDPNGGGNSRKSLQRSVEDSLRRLNTDVIDVLWVHAWDFCTSVDEVMRSLDDVVSSGKVLYIGISDTPAWIVAHANTLAELRGWTSFVGLQARYNLADREVERDLLPMARSFDLTLTAWAPLAAGLLTGKYTRQGDGPPVDSKRAKQNQRRLNDRMREIAGTVDRVADRTGASSTQVALAWLRQSAPNVVPIAGARTVSQIDDTLGSMSLTLPPDAVAELTESSPIELGFPHDFLNDNHVTKTLFGETGPRILRPIRRG